MPESSATVRTENASRYLQQLCKHFSHKVKVDFDAVSARIDFPPGLGMMTARDGVLSFFCRSESSRGLEVIQGIIDQHLVKFAWREELELDWAEGLPPDAPGEMSSGRNVTS